MTKLICFDMDGVLFEHCNFWLELHKACGTYEEGIELTKKYLKTDYQKLVDEVVARLWKNKPSNLYFNLIKKIKFINGAEETLKELKKRGYKIAVISSGPEDLAKRLKDASLIDYYYTNKLTFKDDKIEGSRDIKNWPIRFGNKASAFRELCQKHNLEYKDGIAVVHEDNDIKLAKTAGIAIAFNPTSEELKRYCKHIIKSEDLKDILEYIP